MPSPSTPCYVLSIGHGNDWSFEEDVLRQYPHCKIDVFDGTNYGAGPPAHVPAGVTFVPKNFDRHTVPLHQTTRKIIDVLKVDCEGCELDELLPFLETVWCVRQLQFEVHPLRGMASILKVDALMLGLNRTFGIINKEPNIQSSDGSYTEFAMRRREECA